MSDILCDYGCGKPGIYTFKNGKVCCSDRSCKCENIRKRTANSVTGIIQSKETRIKRSEFMKGKPSGMKGKYHTKESKEKIGKGSLKTWKENSNQREEFRQRLLDGLSKKMNEVPRDLEKLKKNNEKKRKYMLDGGANYLNSFPRDQKKVKKMIENQRKIKEETGVWIKDKDRTEWDLYNRLVWRITNNLAKKFFNKEELKQRGRKKELGHKNIDHKFSIFEGFKLGIIPIVIGSRSNIDLVDCHYNYSKRSKCSITIEELFSSFEREINERVN